MRAKWNPIGPITAEIEKAAMDRLETAAGYVAGMARSLCPVGKDKYVKGELVHRAGALRRTIRVVRLKGDPKLNIRVYAGKYVGNTPIIPYARSVEFGTSIMPAKPFMRPAIKAMGNRINEIMEKG